jgi:hypothetical protein
MRLAEVATGLVQYICPTCGKYEVDLETGQISLTHEESFFASMTTRMYFL